MIAQKIIIPPKLHRELPERSPERLAIFPIEVIFLGGESFTVELTVGEEPDPDSHEECSWQLDPLWAGRQPWPGLEADE
ncbi:MAG: hypothetical protein JWR69_3539 [Pedosphaera sp.]|nr:hypothetical protein [Pedosphaera sp.]